ncbi:MAG: SHOCT domain-containing protein [Candidatus Cloacimonetes bacterium]|nr:SHOCT domain-containing protein [Candidatus Cloacimonadota bacterium]
MFHGMNGYGWGMGWSWIIGLLFLIVIIWLIVRLLSQNNQSQVYHKTPLDILKERYAKGEIDKEEYEERKKVLR